MDKAQKGVETQSMTVLEASRKFGLSPSAIYASAWYRKFTGKPIREKKGKKDA